VRMGHHKFQGKYKGKVGKSKWRLAEQRY